MCVCLKLYGYGTGWWEGTTLANRATDGGLVAWKGCVSLLHLLLLPKKGSLTKSFDVGLSESRTGQPQVKTVVQFPTEGNGGSLADGYAYGAYINRGKVVRSDDALPSLDLSAYFPPPLLVPAWLICPESPFSRFPQPERARSAAPGTTPVA